MGRFPAQRPSALRLIASDPWVHRDLQPGRPGHGEPVAASPGCYRQTRKARHAAGLPFRPESECRDIRPESSVRGSCEGLSARVARTASTLATGPTPCVWALIGHWNHKNMRVRRRCSRTTGAWATGSCRDQSIAPSRRRSCSFRSSPPPYPTRLPEAPTIRWHGSTIGSGLRFITMPTARAAFGFPARVASSP